MHMQDSKRAGQHDMLLEALTNLQSALDLLDRSSAPAQIGAHVDLAIHDLRAAVAAAPRVWPASQIERNAEPQ
jgi:hypothetical protein